ncbi:MAG: cache and HAMP domain-containing protein, partial [Acidobacteriales bacterium]|nr:cache and HAMP domain-containing protein [Terriglobales bacterium]
MTELDEGSTETTLSEGLRTVPFFQQLAYFDTRGDLIGIYPEDAIVDTILSEQELTRVHIALNEGAPTEVVLTPQSTGSDVVMSFIAPIFAPEGENVIGVLVGRTILSDNPMLTPVVDILRAGFAGSGVGFIMDENNRILLYPADPNRQQETYSLAPTSEIPLAEGDARAFRQRETDGTQDLIYMMPVSGRTDWTIVVTTPNEVVLALAVKIALPMLGLLLLLTAVALPLIILVMRRITSSLDQLLSGIDTISEGDLTHTVAVSGHDEIGRLGQTFEQMRVRLKARLDEQERLLRVSRSVSGSLELFRAMPPILSSALEVSNAVGVRVVVRRGSDDPPQSYAAGECAAVIAPLDQQLMELVQHQGTIVISQLWRIANSLDITALPPRIQGLVALPLRSDTSFHGIFWLAYDHEHEFE